MRLWGKAAHDSTLCLKVRNRCLQLVLFHHTVVPVVTQLAEHQILVFIFKAADDDDAAYGHGYTLCVSGSDPWGVVCYQSVVIHVFPLWIVCFMILKSSVF